MKKYNDTTYAILGILTTDCKSGYAIKQLIDNSLSHFWKISYGQIYPALKLIVEEDLAEIKESSTPGKRDKNEYYLTQKGKETLKNWLEEPIEQLPVERNEILLKLFFGQHQSKEKTLVLLHNYKRDLEKRCQTYITIEQSITANHSLDGDAAYWLFTLDYGKRVTKAGVEWCESTLSKFEEMEDL
ncbi:PadR family transcriptional regulator [Rossellomorea vietnamensis]|uniref:PadR family transcriptional regulator n=2 Tax=Rossellomorea TaxID=2837508 RepID=A0A5D4KD25_9BACI|nr:MULTISPECIES: PadR family transcriptional regulator [Rossellomorea]TYR74786.1 PadR family transcriptional regulator [Rossellomorea vietnamensis]TYS74967.1 PadR family transcriptional regulator [Rossellomorea aquimaris]